MVQEITWIGSPEDGEEFDPESMANDPHEEEIISGPQDTLTINGKTFTGRLTRYSVNTDELGKKTTVKLVLVV